MDMHDAWMMFRCAVIIEMIRVPSRHLIRADLINQLVLALGPAGGSVFCYISVSLTGI